jgi:hypothetical protein
MLIKKFGGKGATKQLMSNAMKNAGLTAKVLQ